jgi:assimilatory nitrate reductase electron transfer subunit
MTGPLRVVLVGYGPVGARFVEELLPSVVDGHLAITVIGAESEDAYNRVLIADYAAGRIGRDALAITDTDAAAAVGVQFRVGANVLSIDRGNRTITLDSGAVEPYDRLVLATGARANVPTLEGIRRGAATDSELPAGITLLRDLADAERVRSVVQSMGRIVVLGAGVLGLEIALAAASEGADVHVVHHNAYPMARNIDMGGGTVLASSLRAAGVNIASHSRAESVDFRTGDDGVRRFDALICADGKRIQGDLLVLSCGVSARTELAAQAGLPTGRGILVDERMRSWGDQHVFAIGDCAHVATRDHEDGNAQLSGGPSGLIAPGWRQAAWLAASLIAEVSDADAPAPLAAETAGVVMLKADDLDVVTAGVIDVDPWDDRSGNDGLAVSQWMDPEHGSYVKMVTRSGVLEGLVCVGMPHTGAELTLLFERAAELPADRSVLLHAPGDGGAPLPGAFDGAFDPAATVCWCNGVSGGRIRESVSAGCTTVAEVGADTRAGTGCGGCAGRITELIARFAASEATVS